jgi:hypothetical protein
MERCTQCYLVAEKKLRCRIVLLDTQLCHCVTINMCYIAVRHKALGRVHYHMGCTWLRFKSSRLKRILQYFKAYDTITVVFITKSVKVF